MIFCLCVFEIRCLCVKQTYSYCICYRLPKTFLRSPHTWNVSAEFIHVESSVPCESTRFSKNEWYSRSLRGFRCCPNVNPLLTTVTVRCRGSVRSLGYVRISLVRVFLEGLLGSPVPIPLVARTLNSYSTQGLKSMTVADSCFPPSSSGTVRHHRNNLSSRTARSACENKPSWWGDVLFSVLLTG